MNGDTNPSKAPPSRPQDLKGHRVHGSTTGGRDFQKIKQYHDEAYLYIEQGLSCDEHGQKEQAVTLYSKGLHCIDLAFDVPQSGFNQTQQQRAKDLLQKMQKIKARIQSRVEIMISTDAGVAHAIDDPPPSYDQATTPTQSDFDMLLDLDDRDCPCEANATELFKIQDGVQIFYITKEGYVSAPSYPSTLAIYKFSESLHGVGSDNNMEVADVFLKVSDWTYPLLAGRSPVLHADWGAYIFPDVTSSGDGNAVGVILPDFVPPHERAKFENILNNHTLMRNQEPSVSPSDSASGASRIVLPPGESTRQQPITTERTSDKISRGLETAAEWITWGVIKGAEKTGDLMKKGSTKLQKTLKPEQEPSKVDPRVQTGLYYTRQATEGMVKVSGYLVKKLGQGTMALARTAAPHLRKQGEKYLPASFINKDGEGKSKLDDVVTVAAGGIKGWATVYVGLEQAAKVLSRTIANETVHVVKHKYGAEAGGVTEDVMYSGANIAFTAYNATNMGATALAKRTAKDTGTAIIEDHHTAENKRPRAEGLMDCEDKSTELRDT